ncbi:MAG: hypothetical protein U1E85_05420 [Rhodocyclaceae bacterium]
MSDAVVIAFFTAPYWTPLVRLAIYVLDSEKRWASTSIWLYGIAFSLAFGGGLFQWINKIPSGIIIGIILLVAWVIMFFGIVVDIALSPVQKSAKENRHSEGRT